jgi:transcriptional regulator with XRE-family HTH domain
VPPNERLRAARLEKGWRLVDLAEAIGRKAPLISMIENGYSAKPATRQAIANALGRPAKELWPDEEEA